MRIIIYKKTMPQVSFCISHNNQSPQTGNRSVLGLKHNLLLAIQPEGQPCPPLTLSSAVGWTWKGLNIIHRGRKSNKMQWKGGEKRAANAHTHTISDLTSILFIGHHMIVVFVRVLIDRSTNHRGNSSTALSMYAHLPSSQNVFQLVSKDCLQGN